MTIFNFLSLIGGLALFLFGMNVMGSGLEKMGGGKFESVLEKMTNNRIKGVLLGAGVTAVIQSSSAVTVMAVGFVNSGIMALNQVVGIIMGANIGTCITSWLLSLTGIESSNVFLTMLKPSTFSPILALIGIVLYMFCKSEKKKELGAILLGFSTLMFGMEAMSGAVAPLESDPAFTGVFTMFSNPILGVLVGMILTAIIQSSSASVGILQALSATGAISVGAAFPIILGQNIGTCITALISSIGTNKNAKRTAAVHLSFNIIGTCVFLIVIYTIQSISPFSFWDLPIDKGGIANFHTTFNVCVTLMFLPFVGLLEKLVIHLIPDQQTAGEVDDPAIALDDRLLTSPGLAIQHCRDAVLQMGKLARKNFSASVRQLEQYNHKEAEKIPAGSYGMVCAFSDIMNFINWKHAAPTFTNFELDPTKFNRYTFYRAILENTALLVKGHMELVKEATGNMPSEIIFAGGASKSPLWSQILADVLGMPVRVPVVKEATALGAAIIAGYGVGLYSSIEEGAKRTVKMG